MFTNTRSSLSRSVQTLVLLLTLSTTACQADILNSAEPTPADSKQSQPQFESDDMVNSVNEVNDISNTTGGTTIGGGSTQNTPTSIQEATSDFGSEIGSSGTGSNTGLYFDSNSPSGFASSGTGLNAGVINNTSADFSSESAHFNSSDFNNQGGFKLGTTGFTAYPLSSHTAKKIQFYRDQATAIGIQYDANANIQALIFMLSNDQSVKVFGPYELRQSDPS